MKIERIQYSLTSATREISRYAATRRLASAVDVSKDDGGYQPHYTPEHEEEVEEHEERPVTTAAGLHAQVRLLNITA